MSTADEIKKLNELLREGLYLKKSLMQKKIDFLKKVAHQKVTPNGL